MKWIALVALVACINDEEPTDSALEPTDTVTETPYVGPARPVAYLSRDAFGNEPQDVGAQAICPQDFAWLASLGSSQVCVGPDPAAVATLDRDANGTRSEIREWPGEVCPDGSQHVGGRGRGEVCALPAGGTVLYLDRDRDGISVNGLPTPAAVCPDPTRHIGGFGLDQACWSATTAKVATISKTLDGTPIHELPRPGDACPADWWHAGGQQFSVVCASEKGGTIVELDPSENVDPCPAKWSLLAWNGARAVCGIESDIEIITVTSAKSEEQDTGEPLQPCPESFEPLGTAGDGVVCGRSTE